MSDRPTILVADDYPENQKLFTLYLRKTYDVISVGSAEAVLETLAETPVAAALLDINYQGGMTGFQLIQHIRADDQLAALPALALTAHASPEDRRRCLDAGFDEYLSKPVTKAQMLDAVQELLERTPAA